jgi:hypothetical protein
LGVWTPSVLVSLGFGAVHTSFPHTAPLRREKFLCKFCGGIYRLKGKAIRKEEAKLLRKREPFEEPIAVVTDLSVIVLAKEKEKARGVFGAFL